jgi:L,D-transpeptidase ErfK/SrfK
MLWVNFTAWVQDYRARRGDLTQVIGQDVHVKTHYTDTLYDLARTYGVGSEEIIRANPHVDPWLPGAGTAIVIPGRRILPPGLRDGIVVNIPEHRLYYYHSAKRASSRRSGIQAGTRRSPSGRSTRGTAIRCLRSYRLVRTIR